jgi:hypothetical protein
MMIDTPKRRAIGKTILSSYSRGEHHRKTSFGFSCSLTKSQWEILKKYQKFKILKFKKKLNSFKFFKITFLTIKFKNKSPWDAWKKSKRKEE